MICYAGHDLMTSLIDLQLLREILVLMLNVPSALNEKPRPSWRRIPTRNPRRRHSLPELSTLQPEDDFYGYMHSITHHSWF